MGTDSAGTGTERQDADVVARCRTGEDGAAQELVRRFSPYVDAITVRAYRLSEQDAEDVFQEVFLRTWGAPRRAAQRRASIRRGSASSRGA